MGGTAKNFQNFDFRVRGIAVSLGAILNILTKFGHPTPPMLPQGGHYLIWACCQKYRFLAQNGSKIEIFGEVIFFSKIGPKYREEENLMSQPPRWRFPVGTEGQGEWRSHSESIRDSMKLEDLPISVSRVCIQCFGRPIFIGCSGALKTYRK